MIARTAAAELLFLFVAACGASNGASPTAAPRASASGGVPASPPPAASIVVDPVVDAAAPVTIVDAGPPPTLTVRPSDVVVTGGLGYADDRYSRPNDPKPGDKIEVVRVFCTARGKPEEDKQYSCSGAAAPTSDDGRAFAKRVRQCFDVKERAATTAEAAKVGASLATNKYLEVPRGQLYATEIRYSRKEPERIGVPCKGQQGHPCDPTTRETGRMLDVSETHASAVGPARLDASNPYWSWPLDFIDITPMPASIEGQSHVVRVAMLYDRAIEAVRSKDRARIEAAVKELDDDVHGFEDRSLQPIAMQVSNNLQTLRALAAGRATIGDACKR